MDWKEAYKRKLISPEQAVSRIKSGDRIAMGGGSAPAGYRQRPGPRYMELENVTLVSGITMYMLEIFKPEIRGHINFKTLFMGPLERMILKQKGNVEPDLVPPVPVGRYREDGKSQRLFLRGDAARFPGIHEPGSHRRI